MCFCADPPCCHFAAGVCAASLRGRFCPPPAGKAEALPDKVLLVLFFQEKDRILVYCQSAPVTVSRAPSQAQA